MCAKKLNNVMTTTKLQLSKDTHPNQHRIAVIGNQIESMVNFRGPLIADLVNIGMEVYAIVPGAFGTAAQNLKKLGACPVHVPIDRTGLNPIKDLLLFFRLLWILRDVKPNTVFSYFAKPVVYGSLAAYFSRVPNRYSLVAGLGYSFIDDETNPSIRKRISRAILSFLYKIAFRKNTLVFFQNPDDRNLMVDRRIVPFKKTCHINGTGVQLYSYSIPDRPMDVSIFLLVARMIKEKGIYDFVEAARIVRTVYPTIRFVLVGGTDQNPSAIEKFEIDKWVRGGVVEWVGHVQDVRPWYEKASVFVLPSYYREGVPRSTQEAMASGLPVITTDAPGCRETVTPGVNGLLVPPRDPHALANAMIYLIEHPEVLHSMGNSSRHLAEKRFDVRCINAKMIDMMGLSR